MADLKNTVNPLSWQVPIVNKDGTPTNEFMRKWLQQAATNGSIPDLSTSAAVSAALDKIGAARGDVLYRGEMGWVVLPPGTSGDALLTGGAGADPSWGPVATNIQTLLDGISTAQGAVLFRGVSGWVALAPGTAGQVLTTGGAAADVSWEDGGGTPTTLYPGLDQIMDRWPLDLSGKSVNGGGGGSSAFLYTNPIAASLPAGTTSETALMSYSLPANTLANVGDCIISEAQLRLTAAGGGTRTARLQFGTFKLGLATTTANYSLTLRQKILKVSASHQLLTHTSTAWNAAQGSAAALDPLSSFSETATLTATDTAAITIQTTGQAGTAGAGAVVCDWMTVQKISA